MKMLRATVLALGSCALAATLFAPAYIKFDGVDGESSAKGHEKWIELQSFSTADAQAAVRDAGSGQASGKRDAATGMATGKRQHKPFVFTKTVDKSSPKLAEAAAKGKVFKTVEIGEANGSYILTDVVISSVQPSSGGDRPMESLSLNYTKIEWVAKKGKSEVATERAKAPTPVRAP
ncbi:MAG TPA: type VI secretion system tube protein Hcp [Opitutaceae bacterium]|nr:type VI secretion system tube protein Hcp [Opitutaceae bacterium]